MDFIFQNGQNAKTYADCFQNYLFTVEVRLAAKQLHSMVAAASPTYLAAPPASSTSLL